MNTDMKEIASAMEAILFAGGEPVDIKRICLALELDRPYAPLFTQGQVDLSGNTLAIQGFAVLTPRG